MLVKGRYVGSSPTDAPKIKGKNMNEYDIYYLILFLIQEGHSTTKSLIDVVQRTKPSILRQVRRLEEDGYITVEGLNKFEYRITKQGEDILKGKPIIRRYESGYVSIKIVTSGRVYYKKFKSKEGV